MIVTSRIREQTRQFHDRYIGDYVNKHDNFMVVTFSLHKIVREQTPAYIDTTWDST
jgi:hypothetical protein